jgi:hypothetical protein
LKKRSAGSTKSESQQQWLTETHTSHDPPNAKVRATQPPSAIAIPKPIVIVLFEELVDPLKRFVIVDGEAYMRIASVTVTKKNQLH